MEKQKVIEYLYSKNKPKFLIEKKHRDYLTVNDVLERYLNFFERLNSITNNESPDKIVDSIKYSEERAIPRELIKNYYVSGVTIGDNSVAVQSCYGNTHIFKGLDRFLSDDFTIKGERFCGDCRICYYKGKKLSSVEEFFKDDKYYEFIPAGGRDLSANEHDEERRVFKEACKTINYYWNGEMFFSIFDNLGPVAFAGYLLKDKEELKKLRERNALRTTEAYEKKQEFYHIFPIKLSNGDYLLFRHPAKYLKEFNDYEKKAILVTDKLSGKKEFISLDSDDLRLLQYKIKVDSTEIPDFLNREDLFTDMFKYENDIRYMRGQFSILREKESMIDNHESFTQPNPVDTGKSKKEKLKKEIIELREELSNRINELNGLIDEQNNIGDEIMSHVYLESNESNIEKGKSRDKKLKGSDN